MNERSINALTDVPFIPTTEGLKTVRTTLLEMHKPGFQISKNLAGYEYSTTHRFLASTVAVVIQELNIATSPRKIKKLLEKGLPEDAVDAALERLAQGSDVFDPFFPFMQQPALNIKDPKNKTTYVGPGIQPVKKLSPSMPPDEAEDFWHLLAAGNTELDLTAALQQLVGYQYLSLAGNNSYDGRKCQNGAPSMRFVGENRTATEIIWESTSLLASILLMIPLSWAVGQGLPAWADRKCEHSRGENGPHPLWRSTWSSNAPAVAWKDDVMVGVRTGGIPENWYLPEMGETKESRKKWWDTRNESDPYYLYRSRAQKDGTQELVLQRLDLGTDATALAVEWAAKNKTKALLAWQTPRLGEHTLDDRLLFVRHRVEGTASSANIRASEIFAPSREKWSYDLEENVLNQIALRAELIQKIHNIVISPFRTRDNSASGGRAPLVIDFLKTIRPDASTAFWRHINAVFTEMLREVRSDFANGKQLTSISPELRENLIRAADGALEEVVEPYYYKDPALISYVQNGIRTWVRQTINKAFPKPNTEKEK